MSVKQVGSLTVITGCVASGKTIELIRQIKRGSFRKKTYQVFRAVPNCSTQSGQLVAHSSESIEATLILNPEEIVTLLHADTVEIFIDDAHFFDHHIITTVAFLLKEGIDVVIAGLDLDSDLEPYPHVAYLMAQSDSLLKLCAVCSICDHDAHLSKKIEDLYVPRCRDCFHA